MAPLVETELQGAYRLGGDERRRISRAENGPAMLGERGLRAIPPEMRRPPKRPPIAASSRSGGIMALKRNHGGRRKSRNS